MEFLVEQGGIPATRLSAAGYGQFKPRVPNNSDDARAKNRRVDLIILRQAAPATVPQLPMTVNGR